MIGTTEPQVDPMSGNASKGKPESTHDTLQDVNKNWNSKQKDNPESVPKSSKHVTVENLLKVNIPSVDTSSVSQELEETDICVQLLAEEGELNSNNSDSNKQTVKNGNSLLTQNLPKEEGLSPSDKILQCPPSTVDASASNCSLKKIQDCVNNGECFKSLSNCDEQKDNSSLTSFMGKVASVIKNVTSLVSTKTSDGEEDHHEACPKPEEGEIVDKRVPNTLIFDTDSDEDSCGEDVAPLEEEQDEDNIPNLDSEDLQVPRSPISDDEGNRRSSLKRKIEEDAPCSDTKRTKRSIHFDGVTVFYFPRSQGFNCVPSQGGSTLGMARKHFHVKKFSISEHAAEQKRLHKNYINRLRQQRSSPEKIIAQYSSSEESEEVSDVSDSEMDAESFYFLQPLPIRQRRTLLRQSGIRQIESLEKEECKDIRVSREMCGCQCKVYCDPETCQCAGAGIKCQVDRHSFPCGCTRDGCGNKNGRIEFNPIRVRTHFLHTLMRIEIEKRQQAHWDANKGKPNSWLSPGCSTSTSNFELPSRISSSLPFFNGPSSSSAETSPTGEQSTSTNSCGTFEQANHSNRLMEDRSTDYNLTGCPMFSGSLVSPLESATHFAQSYMPNMPSFGHSNGLASTTSFPASSFAYSPAAVAAAVAAVVPNGNPYTLQSGFCNGSLSQPAFDKIQNLVPSLNGSDQTPCYDYPSSDKMTCSFSLSEMLTDASDNCNLPFSSATAGTSTQSSFADSLVNQNIPKTTFDPLHPCDLLQNKASNSSSPFPNFNKCSSANLSSLSHAGFSDADYCNADKPAHLETESKVPLEPSTSSPAVSTESTGDTEKPTENES